MGDVAIRVEGLSKQYFIGGKQERYRTFRDTIADAVTAPVRRIADVIRGRANSAAGHTETFWALKDVSFDVKHGEVVGIIGRNGAGKSTLLKILARITEPTEGRVRINGRVGALLEVGTGFHPELTGRENIYLNGAILGMSRHDLDRKFDEIVDFAGVAKFIDTPVKHYSSGMSLRLGFAVAAHLEPEILIVDEVLAVGDAEFQKKCLGKMNDVAREGRTVLFVSHQMAAIQNLCQRVILLNSGKVSLDGPTKAIIGAYLNSLDDRTSISLIERPDRKGSGDIRFTSVTLKNRDNVIVNSLRSGDYAVIAIEYKRKDMRELRNLQIAVGIDDSMGQRITVLNNETTHEIFQSVPMTCNSAEICVERLPLAPGRYGFTLFSTLDGAIADWVQNAGFFDVEAGDFFGTGKLMPVGQGNFLIDHHFRLNGQY